MVKQVNDPHQKRLLTLPEQIADDLAGEIAKGSYKAGERLLETELADHYDVSRGPVREAIRLVAQRGLAVLYPRRGAYVVELSLDTLIDLFNTRAVLMGLAARYFAAMADDEAKRDLTSAVEDLQRVSADRTATAAQYVQTTTRISHVISRQCGSESLARIIDHQNESSMWGTLWRKTPIDFRSPERRKESAADYALLAEALKQGEGERADTVMRRMIRRSRENAVAGLSALRGSSFDKRRLLTA